MTTSVLAIDQGTSSTKAVVVDGQGAVRGLAEVGLRPQYKAGGLVEQDPRELMDSVRQAGRAALDEAGIPVDGVALTNQGETVLAWDPATGEPLTTMLVWQDGRAASVCNRLSDKAEMVAQRTGLVLDPYFSAPKMAWLRENQTRDGVVTTSDTWIVHQLSGEFVTDAATAGRSLITCLDTAEFDAELVEMFGLEHDRLPKIVPNDQVIGTTSAFGPSLPLGGLIVDQQGALLAEHCLAAGEAKCTFGTGAFFLTNLGRQPVRSTNGLVSCVAWSVDGQITYCSDGQVLTAASAVRWLQDIGLIAGPTDLDKLWKDDTGGVVCVPALAGLAAPWWRPDAAAVWQGMTLSTSREDLVSAMVQGMAAQVAELADLVAKDMGRPLTRLRVDGGLTRSHSFMQAVSDLTQLPIDVYPSAHATPLGAVALMRKALEPGLALPDAIIQWEASDSYEPAWSVDRAEDFRNTWRKAVEISLGGSK